jgi:hemolysin activation/secretion protein
MTAARLFVLFICIVVSFAAIAAGPSSVPPNITPGAVEPGRVVPAPSPPHPSQYYLFEIQPSKGKQSHGDEGERIFVRSIIVRGVIEHPSLGITLENIRSVIEKFRSLGQVGKESGGDQLTQGSPSQDQKNIQSQGAGPNEKSNESEKAETTSVQDPNAVMLNAHLSIGQLQDIAGELTNLYRKNGFILAQSYVPEQKVENGDVVIQIVEGKLNNVVVENNHLYGRTILLKPFDGYAGKPVLKQSIESGILRVNDYPGLSVFGVFRPGPMTGTTDLVLKVQDERRLDFSLQGDNYGSKVTGEYRVRGDFSLNNVSDSADVLNGSLLATFNPANNLYGAFSYERPLKDIRDSAGFGYSNNSYSIGGDLADLGVTGSSEIENLYWRRSFQRGIQYNSYALMAFALKNAKLSAPIDTTDKLSVVSAEYGFNSTNAIFTGVNIGLIRLSQGLGNFLGSMQSSDDPSSSRHGGSGQYAGGAFTKLEFRYDRVQRLTINDTVSVTVSGQYSNDLLTSIEQMALGGPTSVRAYPISEFLVDSGYFASMEWVVRAPGFANTPAFGHYTWGQILQVAVFVDIAGGTLNDPLPTDQSSVNISGIGTGLRFNFSGFSAHLDVAKPMSKVSGQNVESTQAYVNIIYKF